MFKKMTNYILKHPYMLYFNFKDRKISKLSVFVGPGPSLGLNPKDRLFLGPNA